MDGAHKVGDLLHIPQSVSLLDCGESEQQLVIPLRVKETQKPSLGVVTHEASGGYIRVYCDGTSWSVKNGSIYTLENTQND